MIQKIQRPRYRSPVVEQNITGIRLGKSNGPRDKYEVVVKFMEGDADGWQYRHIIFDNKPSHTDHMIEFLNFLTRCSVAYRNGKGGCDGFEGVEGYSTFVDVELSGEEIDYSEFEKYGTAVMDWPLVDWEYIADFECAEVFYYNVDGLRHDVDLLTA